jgi:hypothetical protein
MRRDQFASGVLHVGKLLREVRRREKMDSRLPEPAGYNERQQAARMCYAFDKFRCLLQIRSPCVIVRNGSAAATTQLEPRQNLLASL